MTSLEECWGRGKAGNFFPAFEHGGKSHRLFYASTNGSLMMAFGNLKLSRPFDDDSKREELRQRLNRIAGVAIPPDAIGKYPTFPLTTLKEPTAMKLFLETLDWVTAEIRSV
jgi:hypothetical protein